QPLDWLQLRGSYAHLIMHLDTPEMTLDPQETDGSSPRNQASFWSRIDLPFALQADAIVRYVDVLPQQNVSSYTELDLRLARRLAQWGELSIVGRDLLHDDHREFRGGTRVERSFFARLRVMF
ncbi:MAG TPA: hypothetical protein VEB21_14725, partial [Terriglobales bacterium]|nr:hypothetical protein [Terriglobales bacterium]